MDLHHTPSHAPVRDAEPPPVVADPVERSPAITLEEQITELWGHINADTAHFLTLIAEFDRRDRRAHRRCFRGNTSATSGAQWCNVQSASPICRFMLASSKAKLALPRRVPFE